MAKDKFGGIALGDDERDQFGGIPFVEPASKAGESSKPVQAALGLAESYGQGSGDLVAGLGQFIQAPAASTLSGVMGARAMADKGLTWLINKAGGEAVPNTEVQTAAQDAAGYAMQQRKDNLAAGNIAARLGVGVQGIGDDARTFYRDRIAEDSPELVRQSQQIQNAEGFVDKAKAMITNPLGTAASVAQSLPSMVAGAGAGSIVAKGVAAAGRVVGASEAAIESAAVRAAESAGVATEGATSAMQTKQQVADFVLQQPLDQLAKNSDRYRELVASGQKPEEARARLAEELGAQGAVLAGTWTSAAAKATGAAGAMAKTVVTGKSTGMEALKGIGKEALEEAVQNPGENFMQYAAQVQADPSQKFDFGGSVAEGLVSGAAMAGPMQGAGYAQHKYTEVKGKLAAAPAPADPSLPPPPPAAAAPTAAPAPAPTAAEKALREPTLLTGLDQVNQLDADIARTTERTAELNRPDAGYGPMFDQERQELATKQQSLEAERAALTKDWPKSVPGEATSFSTEAGARVGAQYALMDVADLTTSHDENLRQNPAYPQELQPRERDRAASEMQVSGIVQKLDPARLGLSADAATGSPIVGADGLVESGNARTIALKRVYQADGQKAADYRQYLRDNAAQFGLTPEAVDAMAKPVLVRVRTTPVNRAEFARQANASTVAQMSPSEQARSDSQRIDSMDDLEPDDNGDFSGAASRGFVSRFMARLPVTEQAGMIDSTGRLSTAGYARVRNAVLAKAYGDSPVLQRMTESMDDNLRNVSRALLQVAPKVAQMREAMAQGNRHAADITPDLLAAVEELSAIKDGGGSVGDALAQTDLLGDKHSPEARAMLTFLADNIRRPRRMADFVLAYMEALDAAGDPRQGSMFDGPAAPSKTELMGAAQRSIDATSTANPAQDTKRADAGKNQAADDQAAGRPADAQRSGGGDQGDGAARPAGAAQEEVAPGWKLFDDKSGTLGIPRAEMPQLKGEHRGALIQFLQARGITHETLDMPASELKATQAEYSPSKAAGWAKVKEGSDRSVLAASDGHILDGHHQWVAALEAGEPIKVIRFNAPIQELMAVVREFPSVQQSEGGNVVDLRAKARQDFKDALGDLAEIASKHTRVALMPQETPGLMPTLVKLMTAGIQEVGYSLKDLIAYVKGALKADPQFKTTWNKISQDSYRAAAQQALKAAEQGGAPADLASSYDPKRDNFDKQYDLTGLLESVLAKPIIDAANGYVARFFKNKPDPAVTAADRAKAEELLAPMLKRAQDAKPEYDQKILAIVEKTGALGQMLAPIKGLKRASEKLVEEGFDTDSMKDLLRSTIVVNQYSDAQAVIDEISREFDVLRIKNRTGASLSGPALKADDRAVSGGYADVLINITMPNGVVAEIQINVPSMLAAKADQGHKLYEAARDQPKGSLLQADIYESMTGFYDAAFEAAKSRLPLAQFKNAASVSGPASRDGNALAGSRASPESASLKTLPSGKATNSSPLNDATNLQPAGNLSGSFTGKPLDSNVAQISVDGYSTGNPLGDSDANGKPGQGSNEGQGPGAASKPAGRGQAQRLRERLGQSDLFGDSSADAGAATPGEVGQPGRGGVRGEDENGRLAESGDRPSRPAGVPAGRDIAPKSGRNYAFGPDDLTYKGSWAFKAEQNVAAVELLKKLEADGAQATPEEQRILAQFIGWGSGEMANNLFGAKLDKKVEALAQYDMAVSYFERNGGRAIGQRDPGFYAAFSVLKAADMAHSNYYAQEPITRAELDKARPDAGVRRWVSLRDRLKALLTPEEWAEASRSTQYAHYTSKPIVKSMWRAVDRMGFKGGTMLEPGAGNGVFPGLMPPAMAANSIYTGIEFDSITGGILKQLFPDERILVESFIDSKLPKNFYDVAVGNPPFSGTKILGDPEYAKHAFSLHDYFFAKTIDRVKPGGLVVFVTSRYTMDKLDDKARKYLSDRADLVGAIRLPQTAFKQNAGTDVVTDVLFLRKKVKGETFDQAQAWGKSVPMKVGGQTFPINEYFHAHPEMVLGSPSDTGKMQNSPEPQYTVLPLDGDIEALFDKAAMSLPADIYTAAKGSAAEAAKIREIDFNPKAQKEGNYYVTDKGALMQREGGVGMRVELKSPKDVELLKDFVPLRDALKQAHYDQLNDGAWEQSLATLQKAYAAFTKKQGLINQFTTKTVKVKVTDEETGEVFTDDELRRQYTVLSKLKDDPDYTLVAALEKVNDDTGAITPSEFLTARVLGKPDVATISSPSDALLSSLNDLGHVDIGVIANRLGLSQADTIEALGTAVYQDPSNGWVTADEYLSGNVKRKLEEARAAAKADRSLERNVTVLEAAQPAPKKPSEINAGLGMNWIPGEVYSQFLQETAGVKATVAWNPRIKQWHVTEQAGGRTMQATADWGTGRRNATALLEHALTGRKIRVETAGTKDQGPQFDAVQTEAAEQKLDALRAAFESWLWRDHARADSMVQIYNDKFNTTVPRSFDGRHLTLPGTSKTFAVFDHVKRGAWRIVQRGNTYLAHAVGSGKTFQMVISAMEQKRLGLVKKPMIVVPNHMLQQFAGEWQQLYPAARLMVADENNFHTDNRRRFVSRVALSDLDGVVITHSAFKLLDLDPAFKKRLINEQLDVFRAALEEAGGEPAKLHMVEDGVDKKGNTKYKLAGGGKARDPQIKQIEKQIENMEQKLIKATSSVGKDQNARFDELGVDFLYVDEAHEYRKLDYTTNRQVKGLSPAGSERAFDLYMKSRYLEEKTPGRSLVMASGTPVTNTLAELYSVQKFMDRQALIDRGIEDFDSWAAQFGREKTELESNAAGKYEPVTRFSKFVNVPELTQMFREFADVLNADHLAALLGDKRPKVAGGSRKMVVTPKTEEYVQFQKDLEARMAVSRAWKPSRDEPNNPDPIIRIIGDGRLAAIDMRFMDPKNPSNPDSKLNRLIDDVIRVAKESAAMEYRDKAGAVEPNKGAAMMVFSDLGFGAGVTESRGFNARAWMEKRLRDAGIPPAQVAFMSDFKKSTAKFQLFKDVNAGRIRILVGSSKNMGTGVNAQQRLLSEFHLDSPWFPADLEQREGRIVRQGNKNPLVQIYAYAAKGTYDENMWKMLATKQQFIDQALSGDPNVREIEDLDSQSQFDLAAAMVAEDPRVLQLAGANADIAKMQRMYQHHEDQRANFRAQYRGASDTVAWNEARLPAALEVAGQVQDLSGDKFTAKVGGKVFTSRADWGQALAERFKALESTVQTAPVMVGSLSGFDVTFRAEEQGGQYFPRLELDLPDRMWLASDANFNTSGLAMRAQNAIVDLSRMPAKMRERIGEARAQMDALSGRLETPFPMGQLLADKIQEAREIEAAIVEDGKKKAEAPAAGADAEKTTLSRGPGGGMELPDLQALAARVKAAMPNMPTVHVLATPAAAPAALKAYILMQGAWNDVEGAMHGGELYMFASGLQDALRAEHVLAEHEAAHFGLRAVLGKGLQQTMRMIYAQNSSVRKAATELQRRGKLTAAQATEEVLVDIPTGELAKLKGWRQLVSKMVEALAGHGFNAMADKLNGWLYGTVSEQLRADLFAADLVRAARGYVAGQRSAKFAGTVGGTRLSGTLAEDMQAQEAWLQTEAKARGYSDIEDLLAKNAALFDKLATLWREKHPAASMLSRAPGQPTAAERAESIIQTPAGGRAPINALAAGLSRITGLERLTGAIYNKAGFILDRYTPEMIKAGIVSDYGVPEAVIDQRALVQGRQRVQLRQAGQLIDKLATLTRAESRVAYAWMNETDPKAADDLIAALPTESVAVLKDVQAMIDRLSRDAVALGQLSPDAYERNKFAYLRRSYAKHVLEQKEGDNAKRARAISILGDQYKGRGLTEQATMAQIQNIAPEWWKRKTQTGKADTALKGEKFLRLERHAASGEGSGVLDGMTDRPRGKLLEVQYFPAGEPLPAKYADWTPAGTFEARDTKGDKVVLWRDFTKAEREKMGEVDEARFAIAKTLHGMIHDVETGRYLEWLAHGYALKEGQAIPGQVVDASERYKDTFKPGDWVRVPDAKIPGTAVAKYGKLAGRYLPGPVWNDLRQVVNGQFKPFGDTYAKILTLWKTAKTALSPAVHTNNIMSNMVMADWHDVSASHVSKALRIIMAAHPRDGTGAIGRTGNALARIGIADREAAREALTRYKDSGGDIGGWASQEIARDQLEPLLAAMETELAATAGQSAQAQIGVMAGLQHALMLRFPSAWAAIKDTKGIKAVANEGANLIDLYQSEDDVFRFAAWLKAKEGGATDMAAGKLARNSFLDYRINAPWIQAMRSSAWPFVSFTYRAAPMLLEVAGKKPHKMMKLMLLAGALNALGSLLAGGDDDKERKLLPEEKAGRIWGLVPKLIRMPWNDANGSPVYLDIRRYIPVGDVLDVGQGHSAIPLLPGLQPGGPLVLAGELFLNRQAFTGREITKDTDTAPQQAAKVADYLFKAFMPNLLGVPGTYATTGVMEAAKGKTDSFGREQSVTQAVVSGFGVKLGSYPADVLQRNLRAQTAAQMMEIDRNISGLKRQYQTRRIDAADFQAQVQVEQDKKRKLQQDLAKKLN